MMGVLGTQWGGGAECPGTWAVLSTRLPSDTKSTLLTAIAGLGSGERLWHPLRSWAAFMSRSLQQGASITSHPREAHPAWMLL